jgi:hypothetical protein
MGIDLLLSAAPAPWREHGTVAHPLARADGDVLRRRADAVPAHVLHAIGICTRNNDLDDPEAHLRALLHDAIAEQLELGIGCAVLELDRAWIIGGGPDTSDQGHEAVTALALSGITELALDADAGAVSPLVEASRRRADEAATATHAREHLRAVLRHCGCTAERSEQLAAGVDLTAPDRRTDLADLLAVTARSATVTVLA